VDGWSVTRRGRAVAIAVMSDDLSYAETERLLDLVRDHVEDGSVQVVQIACDARAPRSFGLAGLLAALQGQAEGLGMAVQLVSWLT
jgi:hypothetical protein